MRKNLNRMYQLLPVEFRLRIDCRRRRKYWNSRGIVFIHVPKAAGTSISHALYGRSLGHFKATQIRSWCPKEFSSLFKFAIVRNPWDRAVSAYKFALKGSTETAGMRRPEQYRIPQFRTFDAFVNEWLSERDLTKADFVFQPQHPFVLDAKGNLLVDYLGKVESLNEDLSRITELTGVRLAVPELNRVAEPGSYRQYYTDHSLINKVGEIYRLDVSAFDYDF